MMQFFDNYSPVGDLSVVAICAVLLLLMYTAYIQKTRYYRIFRLIVIMLGLSAISNVAFHFLTATTDLNHPMAVYLMRIVYHTLLYSVMVLYAFYAVFLLSLNPRNEKNTLIAAVGITVAMVIVDLFGTVFRFGFYVEDARIHADGGFIFSITYMALLGIIAYIMVKFRNSVYKRVYLGVFLSVCIAFGLLVVAQIHGQGSFVAISFLFPTISILYLIHSNPYDISIGAINRSGFEDNIRDYFQKGRQLILMSLYMPEYAGEGTKYPEAIQQTIRDFVGKAFVNSVLFQVENGFVVLSAPISVNPNYEQIVNRLLNMFDKAYAEYKKDYKIVFTDTIDEISRSNEYVQLIRYVHSIMPMNSVRRIQVEDIEAYRNHKYIIEQLEDIVQKKDLSDERVAVYCQPVFNLATESYDTAEALMRLKLPHVGMVFPDQFIPIAEERGMIHTLSLIILNKTCQQIRNLVVGGYQVRRISVNFSVTELRDDEFCNDVNKVISRSGIATEKVAIEITESQNEADFALIKKKILELHSSGIKFYLDDFGTGYSNIERIMELPFDIIKFDRSLVLACAEDKKSEMMVGSLASMFSNMDYSVLYEGVETEQDEKNCIHMAATYLQGYKYSRPIPIERLTEYFERGGKKSGKEPVIGPEAEEEIKKTAKKTAAQKAATE